MWVWMGNIPAQRSLSALYKELDCVAIKPREILYEPRADSKEIYRHQMDFNNSALTTPLGAISIN